MKGIMKGKEYLYGETWRNKKADNFKGTVTENRSTKATEIQNG